MNPLDLNIDLTGTDTAMPCLSDGLYNMTIKSLDKVENKAKTGFNLVAVFVTTTPATSVNAIGRGDSNDISAGFPVRKWYPLQQSENPNAPDFKRDLAVLQEACLGATGKFDVNQLVGKTVSVKVKARESDDYGWGNEVGRVGKAIV